MVCSNFYYACMYNYTGEDPELLTGLKALSLEYAAVATTVENLTAMVLILCIHNIFSLAHWWLYSS